MPHLSINLKGKSLPRPLLQGGKRLWRALSGLADDFWYDGDWTTPDAAEAVGSGATSNPLRHRRETGPKLWHAEAGEISEKMWGAQSVTPGDKHITDLLIRPLGLTNNMNVLDLSAGLGSRLRRTTEEYGVYIDGFEPDEAIAVRGMKMSKAAGLGKRATIAPYDPMNFVSTRSYDCVIMRETIYRLSDKGRFVKSIATCCKPQAQLSFTDYIIDPEAKDHPAILAWKAFEQGAAPLSLVEMAGLWAKNGFTIRVHDDQTEYYRNEALTGLKRLATFLASAPKPDADTKRAINKRITTWAHRIAAFDAGMKFYRFYGLR